MYWSKRKCDHFYLFGPQVVIMTAHIFLWFNWYVFTAASWLLGNYRCLCQKQNFKSSCKFHFQRPFLCLTAAQHWQHNGAELTCIRSGWLDQSTLKSHLKNTAANLDGKQQRSATRFCFWSATSTTSTLFIAAMCNVAYTATFWPNYALQQFFEDFKSSLKISFTVTEIRLEWQDFSVCLTANFRVNAEQTHVTLTSENTFHTHSQ